MIARSLRFAAGAAFGAASLAPFVTGAAQRAPQSGPCDGATITTVDIRTHPPRGTDTATVAGTLAAAERSFHQTTRRKVVAAYVLLRAGGKCNERDRAESERLLRELPFLASASVRVVPDPPGRVRVIVEATDEVPIIVGGSLRGARIASLSAGSENVGGQGLTLALAYWNGFAYRDGYGFRAIQYGAFGRPWRLSTSAALLPLGDMWAAELSEPLLSQYQYRGFHLGAGQVSDHYGVMRPAGDPIALEVRRITSDAAIVTRINPVGAGGPAGIVGAALIGEDVRTNGTPVLLSDSGYVNAASDPIFNGRYTPFRGARAAMIGGLRAVRFQTVHGFDALTGAQDVGTGFQLDALGGPGIGSVIGPRDTYLIGSLYLGAGNERSFEEFRAIAEGRTAHETSEWHDVAVNAQFSWYQHPSESRTRLVHLEYSAISKTSFPLQLTFRDGEGGMHGWSNSRLAGGTRVVGRWEERMVDQPFGSDFADIGAAFFLEAGHLWPGDVPYGATSGLRGAVGISLLGAYPAGGKRTYRVDLAVPIAGEANARWEIRFSASDRTGMLWMEPGDIQRARTGAVPANLLGWLPR